MAVIQWVRYQAIASEEFARQWLQIQSDLGLAQNTVDAYGRGLEEYLRFLGSLEVPVASAARTHVAAYVASLRKPLDQAGRVVCISSTARLSNATIQQRLTACRLFYDFLLEEQQCERNPVGRGRFTANKALRNAQDKGLIPRFTKLPWIPQEVEWALLIDTTKRYSLRTRLMFALSYDAALRREELCSLATSDIDPAKQLLRIRSETTKNRFERVRALFSTDGYIVSALPRFASYSQPRARTSLFVRVTAESSSADFDLELVEDSASDCKTIGAARFPNAFTSASSFDRSSTNWLGHS